jgi:hypothetical protein
MKNLLMKVMFDVLLLTALTAGALAQSAALGSTTAWHDGRFHVDVAGVIGRSDIVL